MDKRHIPTDERHGKDVIVFIDTETITEEELREGDAYESEDARISAKDC